jgi:hypothetical protein
MDYQSLGIFFLGLAFAFFAIWKAYRLKDPYPGFDEIRRTRDATHEQISEFRDDYFHIIDDAQTHALAELRKEKESFLNQTGQFQHNANFIRNERNRFQAVIAKAQDAFNKRQTRFHQLYTYHQKLVSPELPKIMKNNTIELTSPEVDQFLEDIAKSTLTMISEAEAVIKRYLNEREQQITRTATEFRENAVNFFREFEIDANISEEEIPFLQSLEIEPIRNEAPRAQ